MYQYQKRYFDAEPVYKDCLALRKLHLGASHSSTLISMNNLAEMYMADGRLKDAEPLLRSCYDMRIVKLGPEHPNTLKTKKNLIDLFNMLGLPDELSSLLGEDKKRSP